MSVRLFSSFTESESQGTALVSNKYSKSILLKAKPNRQTNYTRNKHTNKSKILCDDKRLDGNIR